MPPFTDAGVFAVLACMATVVVATRPPQSCRAAMDSYCNSANLASCVAEIRKDGGKLPLLAVRDVSASSNDTLWRCYSPSCLDPTGGAYRRGSHCRMSCTHDAELAGLLAQCLNPPLPSHGREITATVVDIWGRHARDCGMIRTSTDITGTTRCIIRSSPPERDPAHAPTSPVFEVLSAVQPL